LIGQALGTQLVSANSNQIIVGRDGRNSSEALSERLVAGLLSVGCDITDIGLVATPVVYFCLDKLAIANAVMVTGSHNPPKPLFSMSYKEVIYTTKMQLRITNKLLLLISI